MTIQDDFFYISELWTKFRNAWQSFLTPVFVTGGTVKAQLVCDGNSLLIDSVSGALAVLTFEHHEMHDGDHYFVKTWVDIDGAGTVLYFMFRTPNTTTRIHAKAGLAAEDEFTVEIYEDATVSNDGTPLVEMNNDRDSPNTPELEAFAAPTVTDDGTLIWATKVGLSKEAGVAVGLGYEIIAKTNSTYLFKVTKAAAGTHWLDVNFWWYELVPGA